MRRGTAIRRYRLGWRTKALCFWVLQSLPWGRQAYFWVQKHVTHTVPRPLSPTLRTADAFLQNWRALESHFGAGRMGTLRLFEFGAGWDLYGNLLFWCLGANDQLVLDRTRWVRPGEVNTVLRHLQTDPPPGAVRVPSVMLEETGDGWVEALRRAYGITYRAPADATRTGLADGSIDAVVTVSVLEHIPPAIIARIHQECRRILAPDGVMCHAIDYGDHYAHADGAITPYNFLRFSRGRWAWFNPDIHYQNRLRHSEYAALFTAAGLAIRNEPRGFAGFPDMLRQLPLAPEFQGRDEADLACLFGHFVLGKAP